MSRILSPASQIVSATDAVAVSPDSLNDLERGHTRAVYIGGEGNLVVRMEKGTEVTFIVPGGVTLPISIRRVMDTTTATGIIALY